jgi:gamma-glutamyltranspeptidase/glutathione hydrolase
MAGVYPPRVAKPRLGIAAGNQLGSDAGAAVARSGGNAIDACLAAAVMGWVAEPFFASIGGSGFVTVRTPEHVVEVIDGNQAMPITPPEEPGQGVHRVFLDYSDGMYTGIGGGAIGVPGILAAAYRAWERHGGIEWEAVMKPAIDAARKGLPFPKTSAYYLSVTWEPIWAKYPEAAKIYGPGGEPLKEGELFVQNELADALELIAQKGPSVFYGGELGREIQDTLAADGGFITVDDLAAYEPYVREPITAEAFGWKIASNPPPSVGGAVLVHMLAQLESPPIDSPLDRLRAIVDAQRSGIGARDQLFQEPDTIAADIDSDEKGTAPKKDMRSPETTHCSSADADGYACAITESNGYGAGVTVHGMSMNNTLGEEELNPLGPHSHRPGARCNSNMAPSVAYGDGKVVALGSPGATRIVGAVAQAFLRIAVDKMSLKDAVSASRCHLDHREAGETLCYEPGLPGEDIEGCIPRPYDEIHMYFGAVQAASVSDDGTVDAAFDPRRSGGSALV